MGCASSSALPNLPDAHQFALVGADSCAPVLTTLRLRNRFWDPPAGEDFVVSDAEWGQELFRLRGTTSHMKTLRDSLGHPLVHMKRELTAPVPTHNVFDAKGSAAAHLFTIKALPELRVDFQHPTSGQKCRIGLSGNWAKRQASIWMDQGRKGSRTTIGRVFRYIGSPGSATATRSSSVSNGHLNDHYFLAVMGGVDMALMVLICMSLEQAHSEEW
ncbi:unnamed protein product [Hyaloperonospora brassicae]|uniref:Tubby C-terminal domain-containing protein n=1 Tax=Hyaloperonospora brassicae TaxID=162125 RepID=A0AAV0TYU6_HYABA|nr:unnamed protein product [Hyaloperonospora brassicae]